jgi:hypothetical protein
VFLCNATLLRKICHEWHTIGHFLREEKIAKANQDWMTNMMSKADEDKVKEGEGRLFVCWRELCFVVGCLVLNSCEYYTTRMVVFEKILERIVLCGVVFGFEFM